MQDILIAFFVLLLKSCFVVSIDISSQMFHLLFSNILLKIRVLKYRKLPKVETKIRETLRL